MRSTAVVGLVFLLLAGVAAWLYQMERNTSVRAERATVTQDVHAAEREQAVADAVAGAERVHAAELRTAHQERDALAQSNAELRQQLDETRAALEVATTPEAEPVVEEGPRDWRDTVSTFPAYATGPADEQVAAALAAVKWEQVAESMSGMPPLIAELADFIQAGKPMTELPAESVATIQTLNAPLVTTAMGLMRAGVPGTGINGSFSHPGFMTNALAAALEALELPLSPDQAERLERLAADFTARERERVDGYGDQEYVVRQLLDESALKHDYFVATYRLLTGEQHEAVRPPAVRGRTQLDIFSESLMWAGRVGPLLFESREDLSHKVSDWVISRGGIRSSEHDAAKAIVADWVDALPEAAVSAEPDGLVRSGMLEVRHVMQSAGHVLALLETLSGELPLDDAGQARLRAVPGSIVLYFDEPDME